MIEQSSSLMALLKLLQKVPYLASKNLYIVSQYFLDMQEEEIELFCQTLKNLKKNIIKCQICWTFKEIDKDCHFCLSEKRDKKTICVVETWRDLIAIEKTGGYLGVYHVLGGSICPLDGIGPEDLTIKQLIERAKECSEIILALNQTPEGEATSAYIASKLKNFSVKISCLARGLPVGSLIEGMDRLTVYKALAERRSFLNFTESESK